MFFDAAGCGVKNINAYSKKSGRLLFRFTETMLIVYSGYRWDGSTVAGRFYENQQTLRCSILHDVLYQLAKQKDFKSPCSMWRADRIFRNEMKDCGVSFFLRNVWFYGITLLGWPWKFGKRDDLIVESEGE